MNMIPNWAKETFASHGDLIGKSLIPCHNERSRAIIADLLATGGRNAYIIQKKGIETLSAIRCGLKMVPVVHSTA